MKFIAEWLSRIFAFLLLIWILMLVFSDTRCERVHRSSMPVMYSFRIFNAVGSNWMGTDTKISLLKLQIDWSLATEKVFERTVYSDVVNANGEANYQCNSNESKKQKEEPI